MHPSVEQLCAAMAWTVERVLLPELRSSYARIQARELAKLLGWLGRVGDERQDLAQARASGLRRGLEHIAVELGKSDSAEARALAQEIDGHLADAPTEIALAADAEASRRLQARVGDLLSALKDSQAKQLRAALRSAIAEDVGAELGSGPPLSTFEELTQADLEQQGASEGPPGDASA
jgi:hypothetical protein